ncbi:uncharacterized protein CTRU02_209627 [Colletotrichum truncatum]|uniref:Uncharacterized protein n=1 Tax=Colletotrichum truncatum TaxID=5467 RepID=A0ACC3YT39_COLTU|nr:uncharacterized protein CTRU02_12072 [Colletotrichum truncatum]KAF6785140.1 hypothetical protein CTRU02_12072 [Colletotrichum truncatum]
MCMETIALCESCGFHRHMHYHLCMAWIWSFREIRWGFKTPLDSIPKPRDCPFIDGEVKCEIKAGRCPNRGCPGHALKAEQDKEQIAKGTADARTDAEKIEAERIKLGFRQFRPQGFQDPLEVGRPHQRKLPVVIMDFKPEEGSTWGRVRGSRPMEVAEEHTGTKPIPIPIPPSSTGNQTSMRRQRNYNGPMMMPH